MKCFTNLQPPLWTDVFWGLIIFGMMACLIPISCSSFVKTYDFYDGETTEDITESLASSKFYRDSLAAGLYIIIIPAADLLLEFPYCVADYLSTKKSVRLSHPLAVRLTDFERGMFILGVIIRCVTGFMPLDSPYIQLACNSTKNSSTILLTCPVIMFFARCTTTWTPKLTMFVIFLSVVSNIIESFKSFFDPESANANALETTSNIMVFIAAFIAFSLILICLYKYCNEKFGHRFRRATSRSTDSDQKGVRSGTEEFPPKNEKSLYDEMNENYIPAWHMFVGSLTALTYLVSAILVSAYPDRIAEILGAENCAILVTATMILIAEYHIRKHEVASGLVSPLINICDLYFITLLSDFECYTLFISYLFL